jgi:hypothetical protein
MEVLSMDITRYFSYGEETTFGILTIVVEGIDLESAELELSGDQLLTSVF